MKIDIKGIIFQISLLSEREYVQKHGDKSKAICGLGFIDFREDFISKAIIRHEINHAFMYACLTDDAELTPHQVEELMAAIDEYHYRDKTTIINKIYKFLRKTK